MTRINANIPPSCLADWHVIAEIEEIPRVCEVYNYRIEKGISFSDIPSNFTLGKGHVKFFLNKGLFIRKRYQLLIEEIFKRGYTWNKYIVDRRAIINTTFHTINFNDYEFSKEETDLVRNRITIRLMESNHFPIYYKEQISKERAVKMLFDGCENIIYKPRDLSLFQ